MKGENVDFFVAKALFQALSGFRGYPKAGPGEDHFVEAFQSSVVSVAHARAVVASFDGLMPTIREIRDQAFNLRPQFETTVDQRKQWEAEYGPPDAMWSSNLVQELTGKAAKMDPAERKRQHGEERRAMLWQAIRDSLYYTEGPGGSRPDGFWMQAAEKHQRNHPAEVAAFRVELCESGWEKLMAYDWAKGTFPPAAKLATVSAAPGPITQEDINRELRAQGREAGDGE